MNEKRWIFILMIGLICSGCYRPLPYQPNYIVAEKDCVKETEAIHSSEMSHLSSPKDP